MFKTSLRNIAAHKLRLLATALAVTLGVAFMAGTLVFTDTIKRTFNDLFASVYERTDAVVRTKEVFKDPTGFGDQRGRIDAALLPVVASVDGVAFAQGDVTGYAQLVDKGGNPVGTPGQGPPTLGGSWARYDELNPFRLIEGRAPQADDEVVLDKYTADKAGYVVGDEATVLIKGPPLHVRIVGVARFGTADSLGGASYVSFTMAAAERLVAEPGRFDTISVRAQPGVSQAEITRRIQAVLPSGTEAITGAAITKETQDSVQKGMSVFNQFMLVFAFVALFVGGFMIYNSFFITVAQRTRENALLRAIGASKGQVLASVLLEAAVVAVVASLVGLAVGFFVAAGLKALLSAFGMDLPAGSVVFTMRTVVVGLVAGVIVTLGSALSPARKAGKVPPIAAMRDVQTGSSGYGSYQRIIVGLTVLGVGVVSLLFGLFGGSGKALQLVGLGALFVFFGVSVLGRTVSLPLSRAISAPLPKVRGITGSLARQNAMRNPKRTASTASALMIGVGLVAFITIFASSTKASINHTIDKVLTGDFVVMQGNGVMGGLDPALARQVATLPEVSAATGIRSGLAKIDDKVVRLTAADPQTGFDMVDVRPVAGSRAALDANAIAVQKDVARDKGLHVGDKVRVVFKDSGPKDLTVGLIYAERQPAGDWLLSTSAYEANFADQYDFAIFVKKAPDVTSSTALEAIQRLAAGYPGADVLDQTGFKAEQTKGVNQMLGLIYALLGLAVIIALLGIGNTLALSVIERTRELGVLRAVGMTRSQLRAAIRWESVIVAVQGTVLGLVIGLFFGWALVRALSDQGITTLQVPYLSLLVIVVLAALAGVVAALLPARRAARLNVLRAVVSE
jgi:putative ABC transport system permease protein